MKLYIMYRIHIYTIIALILLVSGCVSTTDQPLSSPQDAQILIDALPEDAQIDSTVGLTALGKKNLHQIRSDLRVLASTTSKHNSDLDSGPTLTKIQEEIISFARTSHNDKWSEDIVVKGADANNCAGQCLSSFANGLDGCKRLTGLPGATCSANNLTVYLLCLRNCPGSVLHQK